MSGPSTEGAKNRRSMLRMPTNMANKQNGVVPEEDLFSLDDLDESQMVRLKRAFGIFDKDGSGQISSYEMLEVLRCPPGPPRAGLLPRPPTRLACPAQSMCPIDVPPCPVQVLRLLGSNPSKGEFADMLKSIDTNQDGVVDFMEFARVWWKREQQNLEADFDLELELAFKVFDTDGSGMITRDELREKLTTLGEKLTEDEVSELLAEADSDNNGSISFEEFKALPFWRQ